MQIFSNMASVCTAYAVDHPQQLFSLRSAFECRKCDNCTTTLLPANHVKLAACRSLTQVLGARAASCCGGIFVLFLRVTQQHPITFSSATFNDCRSLGRITVAGHLAFRMQQTGQKQRMLAKFTTMSQWGQLLFTDSTYVN